MTTGPILGLKYKDRDGREISMSNKEVKKIAYCHSTDLGIYNLANRIQCPIQSDPKKFQRTDCWAITDRSVLDVIIKVFELTTISDPTRYLALKIPMPHFPSQNTIAYLDKIIGKCVYFHENGKLWSADRYSRRGVDQLLNDPKVIQNPS